MLVGIYSTEKKIMDVINAFNIEKTQEGMKKKQKLIEIEAARVEREEHERRKKSLHSINPKKVTFENEETLNEDFVEISPNEIITPSCKKNKLNKHKRAMVDDDSIPIDYEEIVDLDETHLNHKRKKSNVVGDEEAIVSSKYYNEIPKCNKEIITLGVNLEDGITKTTQNDI
jgi:hypothetical protein